MFALQPPAAAVATVTLPTITVKSSVGGRVKVRCQADGGGGLEGCALREERPTGLGLGAKAYREAKTMRVAPEAAPAGTNVDVSFVFTATPIAPDE